MTQSKMEFFRDTLVPAGQLLEMLLALPNSGLPRPEHNELAHRLFDTLNLAACYAIHPGSTDLQKLSATVENLSKATVGTMNAMGSQAPAYISSVFGVRHRGSASSVWTNLRKAMQSFVKESPRLCADIHKAIGFDATRRQAWLGEMLAAPSPLTATNRINRWRTFVRNLSWEQAAGRAGILATLDGARLVELNGFGSDAGRKHAKELWETTFSHLPEPSLGRPLEPLPPGLCISTTPDRRLLVTASVEPRSLLDRSRADQLAQRKRSGQALPEHLEEMLRPRTRSNRTDLDGLQHTLAETQAWLSDQRVGADALNAAVDAWLDALRKSQVLEKLERSFNTEERKLLAELLAEKAAR